jgi:hypothetical protein
MRKYNEMHKDDGSKALSPPTHLRIGLGSIGGAPLPGSAPSPLAVVVDAADSFQGSPRVRQSTVALTLPLPGANDSGFKKFPPVDKVMPSKVWIRTVAIG